MGNFVIHQTKNGEYSFNLKAGNGEVILAASQGYKNLENCKKGIASVQTNALAHVEDQTVEGFVPLTHPKFEIYQDKAGEFRFRLKAKNGQNIGKSEGYKSMASCKNGIESVGKNAPEASVVVEE